MKNALLVIDVQQIYTTKKSPMFCQDADKTVRGINQLVNLFDSRREPIVLIRHIHKLDGSDLGRMFDFAGPAEDFNFKAGSKEINFSTALNRPPGALELVKTRYSAFVGTDLDRKLRGMGVGRVVICGFMTNFCCDSTARDAHDLDYFVDFIVDATGTPGIARMKQAQIRDAVGAFLAEGYAEVHATKDYLKKLSALPCPSPKP